jgi:hypothetical protein
MAHPLHHAKSSARKYGGQPEDYLPIHNWFDESKAYMGDVRHRALRHHSEGIFLCERIFGASITNSEGREVPVRFLGEQHVVEDLGRIPSASEWLQEMVIKPWMGPRSRLEMSIQDVKPDAPRPGGEGQGPRDGVKASPRPTRKHFQKIPSQHPKS